MKKLDELGISPWPWGVIGINEKWREVMDTNAEVVCSPRKKSNARLIATAPELYEALREAVIEMCNGCDYCEYNDGKYDCKRDEENCFVQRWREVLANAAGESEVEVQHD